MKEDLEKPLEDVNECDGERSWSGAGRNVVEAGDGYTQTASVIGKSSKSRHTGSSTRNGAIVGSMGSICASCGSARTSSMTCPRSSMRSSICSLTSLLTPTAAMVMAQSRAREDEPGQIRQLRYSQIPPASDLTLASIGLPGSVGVGGAYLPFIYHELTTIYQC